LLQANMMPKNRFYKYDFLFDNCTTRLRDLVERAADNPVHFQNFLLSKKTFRDLIYEYLDKNDKQWSKLGIDILLGRPTDAVMETRQVMFLPDYLLKSFDHTTINSRPLVKKKHELYSLNIPAVKINYFTNPVFIFSAIFLFMWFGTDHLMCKDNYNLLWAWPTNVVAAFYIQSARKRSTRYFQVYAVFNFVVCACWFFLPQHMNPALLPIIAILIFRSIFFISKGKDTL